MEKLFISVVMLLHLKRMKCSKECMCMGSTVCIFFPLLPFFRTMLLRDAGSLQSEGRNNQCIAASMTMCKYVYLVERDKAATTAKYVRKCVFASVFEYLFFLNKHKAQGARLLLYAIYWEPGVLAPLDHDWRHLQICMS